jgi:hypothetical protein
MAEPERLEKRIMMADLEAVVVAAQVIQPEEVVVVIRVETLLARVGLHQ